MTPSADVARGLATLGVDGWARLADQAEVLMGQSPPSSSCSEDGDGLPFIQGNAEFGRRSPLPRLRCTSPARVAEAGDLLLSVRAPVGALNQATERTVIGRGLSALRFRAADQRFAWHAVSYAAPSLNRVAQGSTFVAVSRKDVECMVLPWHDEANPAIAAVLDTVDEMIEKTEAVIAKLRQVRTGLLHDLLACGLDENGQLRDPVAHPEQFQDSPIGLIPKAWTWEKLSELCSYIGSGVTPRGGQDVYSRTGVMLIRSQNVRFEGLLLDDVAFISTDIHQGMLRSQVFANDVLFNITGASIGRCCHVPEGIGPANVNQHVCILRIPQAINDTAKFLASVMSSSIGQQQLEALNTMGNRQGLNYQQLGSFIVPWPNDDELAMIVRNLTGIESQLGAEMAERDKLGQLKSGLMDDLLTGRVRVPEGVCCGG